MTTNSAARCQFVAAANDLIRLMREHGIDHVSLFPKPTENGSTLLCSLGENAAPSGYNLSPGEAWDALVARRDADASLDEEYGPRRTA